ncbi:MAG TPA: GIY-YIG nuclease family protein [Rhabdochlamydiaceae bacterium]|nr:GIY-YIG nuclease family protein [Rhabdochlamydiaceae bacterium]HSX38213.1 GIY-YIG nuclease family protein [Chlamydiales bacterium]
MTLPSFVLSILLPDGIPEGMKIIEKSNWNGCGLSIPRSLFGKHKNRPELQKPGVYLLLGGMDIDRQIYIGEGDPLLDRLQSHDAKKDFWDILIAFTSKDHNLNKAIIQFLEARLYQIAQRTGHFNVLNGNVPQEPSLSEMDLAVAEGYLREMLICLPILGITLNEGTSSLIALPDDRLFIKTSKGTSAVGTQTNDGFLVFAGSLASTYETPSISVALKALRQTLLDKNILNQTDPNHFIFTKDYLFGSPSTAAGIVQGRSANGRLDWKDARGNSIKDREKKQ